MQYRHLGSAGMKVSAISLGGWLTYGGSVSEEMAAKCVQAAIENGVNYIDLADVYAGGQSERVTGAALQAFRRDALVVSSKVFWPMSGDVNDRGLSRKHIMQSVEGSLRRLEMDYLDIYFCHRYDPETPVEEVVRAMDDLVHQGKVLYWGTSVWSAGQIERAVGIARSLNAYAPQVEQPRYNMLDRHIEAEIMATAAHYGMGITVFSPLAQGILSGKYNAGLPEGSRGATTKWLQGDLNEANLGKVRALSELAAALDLSINQLALAWILRRPEISCAITGATAPEQVLSNVKAADVVLAPDTLAEIEKILGPA